MSESLGIEKWLFIKNIVYRVPSKETQWELFKFVCKKSLNAKHIMTFRRWIQIKFTEFLSGEHGRSRFLRHRSIVSVFYDFQFYNKLITFATYYTKFQHMVIAKKSKISLWKLNCISHYGPKTKTDLNWFFDTHPDIRSLRACGKLYIWHAFSL